MKIHKKIKLIVEPLKGINEVCFDMRREDVHRLMGLPDSTSEPTFFDLDEDEIAVPRTDYYLNNALQISYDQSEKVEYIEVATQASNVQVELFEINVSMTSAHTVIDILTDQFKMEYDTACIEIPYSYTFLEESLSFWRPVLPENDSDGEGRYFDSVAVGRKGYFKNS